MQNPSYNRNVIAFALFKPDTDSYYGLIDECKVGGIEIGNPQSLLSANEDTSEGKLHDSFPTVWREVLRTFQQGGWRSFQNACKYMAEQCILVRNVERAVYYAILSQNEMISKKLGTTLLFSGSHDLIEKAVTMVLNCAQLKRHFAVACDLIESLMDGLPDNQVEGVFSWLLKRAAYVPISHFDLDIIRSAWRAIESLTARISENEATQLMDVAINHPCLAAQPEENHANILRKDIIATLLQVVDKLPKEAIGKLVENTVLLATSHKEDYDYNEVINLLCACAKRGEKDLVNYIRERLYPTGQRLNAILIQVAPVFGQSIHDSDSWEKNAKQIADNIRLQVQRIPKDTEPRQMNGAIMYHTANVGSDKLVCIVSSLQDIYAILRHREWVPSESLCNVINAILDMIESPDNLITNKIAMIQCLKYASGLFSDELGSRIRSILLPFAHGDLKEPEHVMPWSEANDPMNPFKMPAGNPSDLRGVSLFIMALLEKAQPGLFGEKLDEVIDKGLLDSDSNVRSFAFAAAREIPTASQSAIVAILLGTRDTDEKAANAAFTALANKVNLKLNGPLWRLFIQSVRLSRQNGSAFVRKSAARAAFKLKDVPRNRAVRKEIADLIDEYSKDICYSVRVSCSNQHEFA